MKYTNHPKELEAVKKTMSFDQAREATWLAFRRVMGKAPSAGQLALLLAHSALETGNWQVGLWNWNFGNVKASATYDGFHQYFRCNEKINGAYVWFDPPHPQTRFRAYQTAADGCEAHIKFLAVDTTPLNGKPNVYALAWDALLRVEPATYVAELKQANYFTADFEQYRNTVVKLFNAFIGPCANYRGPSLDVPDEHSPVSDLDLAAIADQLATIAEQLRGMGD